jgi:hypothetical protein
MLNATEKSALSAVNALETMSFNIALHKIRLDRNRRSPSRGAVLCCPERAGTAVQKVNLGRPLVPGSDWERARRREPRRKYAVVEVRSKSPSCTWMRISPDPHEHG